MFSPLTFQLYTDFDEIRQEIENETERISGNNKVRAFDRKYFRHDSPENRLFGNSSLAVAGNTLNPVLSIAPLLFRQT